MRAPRLGHVVSLLGIAAFAAWYLLAGPTAIGGPATYVWVSGTSMEPTLVTGDLAIVREAATYEVGDIVTYRLPDGEPGAGALVIHRIVGGSADVGFITQGDNKPNVDPWRPRPADMLGEMTVKMPGAGFAITWIRQPLVFGALTAGVVVFLLMLGGGKGNPTQSSRSAAPSRVAFAWGRRPGSRPPRHER